ncbi:hypothetical protein M406DRAFT_320911 [Cryphonectria parasitica EP155]|uniref:Uncharacterized protein n=1 Tax=Cryphonectria parasitica (strain ATCC 38755 / EP155) TaxID=660469 RepID=A0A9P5CRH9_CRYP1|nr:uncharacterized protein M406DRAFT_320911 [Cryphonectria parasitica EP155]KAF3768589.1 hypothetical protein M406DRAFT_320911 [Cryphonectria parasitica EP155]
MELDLHVPLGEPGSTELVCPVIVQAAALPDHHGPYAVENLSESEHSRATSKGQSRHTTKASSSGSRTSGTLHRRSRVPSVKGGHSGSRSKREGKGHSTLATSSSHHNDGFAQGFTDQVMVSPILEQTPLTEQDARRYSQALSMQSFMLEETWNSRHG